MHTSKSITWERLELGSAYCATQPNYQTFRLLSLALLVKFIVCKGLIIHTKLNTCRFFIEASVHHLLWRMDAALTAKYSTKWHSSASLSSKQCLKPATKPLLIQFIIHSLLRSHQDFKKNFCLPNKYYNQFLSICHKHCFTIAKFNMATELRLIQDILEYCSVIP